MNGNLIGVNSAEMFKTKMSLRIVLACFLGATMWSFVNGSCEIMDRFNGCQYTVHCVGSPGSIYTSNCNEEPNVTFIIESSNVEILSLGFFSRTNFDQRVRSLKATENNWHFIEQNAFKYYKKCLTMDLSKNMIVDIENEAFNELVLLKQLNLSHNRIEVLKDKSLQFSVISQNSLEVLDLSRNLIRTISSNIFSNLVNLKTLFLDSNEIKILESSCFSILRHLSTLSLFNNKVTSLNTTLVTMSELKYLDMSRNDITKLSGIDMIRLVSLTKLNMSQNAIESVELNCFNQAFSLHTLDLSNNRIQTPMEKPMFSYNSNLTYLNLYHNKIPHLGDSIFKSTKLSYFNIENNNLTGDVTNCTFEGLQSITCLNVSYQHITSLKNNAFSEMTNLKHLDLSHNKIDIVEESSFVNASALLVLNISHNLIRDLEFLQMFSSNLTDIFINNNIISIIPEYAFSNHSSLRTLDISENVITTIEANALSLHNIEFLNLKNNNLSGTLVDGVVSPARVLKKLDLSHHNLKAINDSAFTTLPLLESLDLSDNNLQYIDSNNFKGVENLRFLNISNNDLTNLDINGKMENLQSLDLSNNKLSNFPNLLKFVNASNLLILDISYNHISDVVYSDFKSLKHMIGLNASHNNITYFNNEFTNALTNLMFLNLESNKLKEINLTFFKEIRIVNVSKNNITYLENSQFKNLDFLGVLDVSANMIKEIFPGTFQHLTYLKTLILSENNITKVRFGSFRGLNNTDLIDLSRNKINNINVDIFHECYQLTKIIIDYNNITSIDVERFVDVTPSLELISLGGNPIACEEIVKSSNKKFKEKTVQITSMHKIYHEDNVHGIRCGKYINNVTIEVIAEVITTQKPENPELDKNVSSSVILVAWCSVISVLLIFGLGFIYWRHRSYSLNNDTGMRYQNTATRSSINSESFNDLLR